MDDLEKVDKPALRDSRPCGVAPASPSPITRIQRKKLKEEEAVLDLITTLAVEIRAAVKKDIGKLNEEGVKKVLDILKPSINATLSGVESGDTGSGYREDRIKASQLLLQQNFHQQPTEKGEQFDGAKKIHADGAGD